MTARKEAPRGLFFMEFYVNTTAYCLPDPPSGGYGIDPPQ